MAIVELQETRGRRWFDFDYSPAGVEQAPIRAELLSVDRLEQFAATLAKSQPVLPSARNGRSRFTHEPILRN